MSNPFFQFKQFTVRQERCAMKVGTDSVLLGAWVDCENSTHILDVGTGTGLIALMLAQRTTANIFGVELDCDATSQALENFTESPWCNRLHVECCDYLTYSTNLKFDLIVSNPPYFEDSLLSPNKQRTNARHMKELTYESFFEYSVRLLTNDGRIALVFPAEKESLMKELGTRNGLFVIRRCSVLPTPTSRPKRILYEFSKSARVCDSSELTIELARHQYSPKYIELTREYYLKM